jgi:hypothetical protein
MMVLIALAFSLVLFGPRVVSGDTRGYLQKGMIVISVVVFVMGLLLLFDVAF